MPTTELTFPSAPSAPFAPFAAHIGPDTSVVDLVAAARGGCAKSWREIVDRFDDSLRRAARARGLDGATAADVVQQTWLAAVANITALREERALGGWLHTILHRECLSAFRHRRRESPHLEDIDLTAGTGHERTIMLRTAPRSPEEEALRVEQRMLVRMARRRLPERDRQLLALLMADPPLSYNEIARRLGVPVGSIGPTRARCFARLRRELSALGVNGGDIVPLGAATCR